MQIFFILALRRRLGTPEIYGRYSLSPDNDLFVYLATLYASNHGTMSHLKEQCKGDSFQGGITNGAHWYNVRGMCECFLVNCHELMVNQPKPQDFDLQERFQPH